LFIIYNCDSVWNELGLKRTSEWAAQGGFIGVGERDAKEPEPLWTDAQLGVDEVVREMKAAGPAGVVEALLEREREETARTAASAS